MSDVTAKRCVVYTRKSSEEGLDQAFNSLDAQRQAGADYIRSQKHEGWQINDQHYDDGGYSGGTTQRSALKQLLEDIKHGGVDVVVVYKVDRLSRSLHDFAQMMKLFDAHEVSFVSVTQQFNTTTSMGRLTLNMLLSFAQFEREVKRALTGHLPPRVTLTNLLQAAEHLDWQAQHIYLNLDESSHPG